MSSFPVRSLGLQSWRQFGSQGIELDLEAQTTIIAGSNGTGKTTIINVIAKSLGVNVLNFASGIDAAGEYSADSMHPNVGDQDKRKMIVDGINYSLAPNQELVGHLQIGQSRCQLYTPASVGAEFALQTIGRVPSVGVAYLGAHRPPFRAAQVNSIPTTAPRAEEVLAEYRKKALSALADPSRHSPLLEMKQTLIMLSMFGPGNKYVSPNREMQELYEGYSDLLRLALPADFGFERLDIRLPHVTVRSRAGEHPIDSLSGGLSALFDAIWQLHLLNQTDPGGVVLIDEPENHLHPAAQRELLPSLNKAFPQLQKIVVTHNPFVLSSVRDARVYSLSIGDHGVEAEDIGAWDRTGSVDDVLLKTFGIDVPAARWIEDELMNIQESLERLDAGDKKAMTAVVDRLQEIGMLDMASRLIQRAQDPSR